MKIPDNFILLMCAFCAILLGWWVPAGTVGAQMLSQLWAVLLILIQAGSPVLPSRKGLPLSDSNLSIPSLPDLQQDK